MCVTKQSDMHSKQKKNKYLESLSENFEGDALKIKQVTKELFLTFA